MADESSNPSLVQAGIRRRSPRASAHRGARRYYKALRRKADSFSIDLSPGQLYDFWHEHIDEVGRGDVSRRQRMEHLRAGLTALDRVREQIRVSGRPAQTWLSIVPDAACGDALYLHSPGADGSSFPYAFEGFTWPRAAPALLRYLLSGTDLVLGRSSGPEPISYVIVPPESLPTS